MESEESTKYMNDEQEEDDFLKAEQNIKTMPLSKKQKYTLQTNSNLLSDDRSGETNISLIENAKKTIIANEHQ